MRQRQGEERRDEDGRITIDGPEDIPEFTSDEEELEFWRTHTPSDEYLAKGRAMSLNDLLATRRLQGRKPGPH